MDHARQVYDRENARFSNVRVWKVDPTAQGIETAFAPLIIEEITTSATSTNRTLEKPAYLVLGFSMDHVEIHDRIYSRISYSWLARQAGKAEASKEQGVRITLDPQGKPVIWEARSDPTGLQVLFISESLEKKAASAFGDPLPGRRFTIEPDTNVAPGMIVARLLEDGPVAMGPIVYTGPGLAEIITVICRCMPSHASNPVDVQTYAIVPADAPHWPAAAAHRMLRMDP